MYYIRESMEYAVPTVVVMIAVLIGITLVKKSQHKRISILHVIEILAFSFYLSIILGVTISPVYGFHSTPDLASMNLIPFRVLSKGKDNLLNLYGNIAMFVPMGIMPMYLTSHYRKISKTVLFGFLVSFGIEIAQLFLSRGTDIDDVILNTLGTVIGFVIGKLILVNSKFFRDRTRKQNMNVVFGTLVIAFISVMTIGSLKRYQCFHMDNLVINSEVIRATPDAVKLDEAYEETTDCAAKKTKESKSKDTQIDNEQKFGMLQANNVCVYSTRKGKIIYGKSEYEKVAPASTTKMITALVTAKYCDLSDIVTVAEEIREITKDASNAGLFIGDSLSIQDLLYCLLLPSGNDAAYVLATHTGRKIAGDDSLSIEQAVNQFVNAMNDEASRIGATSTKFVRPDGYDAPGQYSTAYDLSIIAEELLKNQTLATIVSTEKKRILFENGKDVVYRNTNEMLDETSDFYDIDVVGIKTGSSGEAGKCLVSGARINGEIYICTVLGDSDEGRYTDSLQVYHALE